MQEAIDKSAALVEAHEYIKRFQGRMVVVKIGGSIMDEAATLRGLLRDLCFLATVGMRPILVHGGGKSVNDAMAEAGIEPQFVQGRRYTDERTLAIAEHVLVNQVNRWICAEIEAEDHHAMGLHSLGSCAVFAKRLFLEVPDAEAGRTRKVDVGHVGEVEWINAGLLEALTEARYVPAIAPIARDSAGGKLNVNADSVAGHVAAALGAEKLVLVSDTHGIRTSEDAESLASHLRKAEIEELIERNVIKEGMLPKVEACITALEGEVTKAHVVDGRIQHSLMLEIYTDKGIGTEIVL